MSASEDIASLLLEIKAVSLNIKKPFHFASGILSPIYCDNRLIISYPEKRKIILKAFLDTIKKNAIHFDVVAGTATAGIPHAAWIADHLNKPMIYVRSKPKEHGKKNLIEGLLEKNQKVLVIEDLISTGESALKAALACRQEGAEVTDCIAIFSYQMQKAEENFSMAGIKLRTLTDFSTLIDIAYQQGYINEKEQALALLWNKDPQQWEKKLHLNHHVSTSESQ